METASYTQNLLTGCNIVTQDITLSQKA